MSGRSEEIRAYVTGYAAALGLTFAAFAVVEWRVLGPATTLGVVFALALVQIIAHFYFFLHVRLGKSSRDDRQLILFSSLIIVLMVGGTLIILFNLRERMM